MENEELREMFREHLKQIGEFVEKNKEPGLGRCMDSNCEWYWTRQLGTCQCPSGCKYKT